MKIGAGIKNFFNNIGKTIKKEIAKVAPKVIDKLKHIAGDLFTKGKAAFDKVSKFVTDRIISPLKNSKLLNKLLGPDLAKKLENGWGSIEKGLKALLDKLQPKQVDGQTVVTPNIETRATNFSSELKAILDAIKANAGTAANGGTTSTTGTSSSAATSSTSSAATGATPRNEGSNDAAKTDISGLMAGLTESQQKDLKDMDKAGCDAKALKMQQMQFKMQNMSELMSFISNMSKMQNDTLKALIGNLR